MRGRAAALAVTSACLAAGGVRSVWAWADLPETMASHFGPGGRPDAFMSKGSFFALFGGLMGFLVVLLSAVPSLARRMPVSLVSLPNREYWLDPARREEALGRLGTWLSWMAASLAGFSLAVLELVIRSNLRRAPLEEGAFIGVLACFLGGFVAWMIGLWKSFRVPVRPRC